MLSGAPNVLQNQQLHARNESFSKKEADVGLAREELCFTTHSRPTGWWATVQTKNHSAQPHKLLLPLKTSRYFSKRNNAF